MTTLIDKLKWSLLAYPTIYTSVDDVLHHLFFVIGNGYQWVNGELVDTSQRIRVPINVEAIALRTRRKLRAELRECRGSFKGIDATLFHERRLHNYEFTVTNIDRIARDPFGSLGGYRSLYPYCKQYARINTMPTDVKTDWLKGAYQHVQSIQMQLRGHREMNKTQRTYAKVLPTIEARLVAMLVERGERRATKKL